MLAYSNISLTNVLEAVSFAACWADLMLCFRKAIVVCLFGDMFCMFTDIFCMFTPGQIVADGDSQIFGISLDGKLLVMKVVIYANWPSVVFDALCTCLH